MRYKRILLLIALVGLICFLFRRSGEVTFFPPFDEAQIQEYYSPKDLVNFYQRQSKKKWRLVIHLYKSQLSGSQKRQKSTRIPKIIHQIWLDGPIPEIVRLNQKSWKEKHPGWEYHLWTENEIEFLYLKNGSLFNIAKDPKVKSDILRYEILYQFGGVFVDNDYQCIKPLDILNENCDFYVGLSEQIRTPQLNNSIIACIPSHPVIRQCINTLRERTPSEVWGNLGPSFLTHCFFNAVKKRNPNIDVALPASFFYIGPKIQSELSDIPPNSFAVKKST